MEKSLGLRLIERGSEGWVLTDAGKAVSEKRVLRKRGNPHFASSATFEAR